MKVREMKAINVLNYNDNTIIVSTKNDGYAIAPASNDSPSILPLSFDEISYINSNSEAFKTGILRFPEDLEEEIYNELKITNWEDILTNDDIKDIILNPTVDGLSRLIKIKNIANFDRVKGMFTRLKNEKIHDISMRVEAIIKDRDTELRRGIRNSGIIIQVKDTEKMIPVDEVNELKEQNNELQKQMLEMQEMMKEAMRELNNSKKDISKETKDIDKEEPKKEKTVKTTDVKKETTKKTNNTKSKK